MEVLVVVKEFTLRAVLELEELLKPLSLPIGRTDDDS